MPAPIPPHEITIGRRLRRWRFAAGVTRASLARLLGFGEERLASYESGRVPLRWEVFEKMWRLFALHPTWLATGDGAQMLAFDGFGGFVASLDPKATFSHVYEQALAPFMAGQQMGETSAVALVNSITDFDYKGFSPGSPIPLGAFPERARMEILASELPRDAKHPMGVTSVLRKLREPLESALVIGSDSLLEQLRIRLVRATSERGKKTALADLLKVPQSTVTGWLKGDFAPSAENTLRLLKYLEHEEAQQKQTAPVLLAPRRRKTKASESDKEKTSSGPPHK